MDTFGRDMKHVQKIKPEHIIKKEAVGEKRSGEVIYEQKFNKDYWQDVMQKYDKVSVVIDEAHTFFNPRRSMSKVNVIMSDFLAMLRRIVGGVGQSRGNLILITQLSRRLDIIAKEMATHVVYCKNYMYKDCKHCGYFETQHNEQPEQPDDCPRCGKRMKLQKQFIYQWHFKNVESFERWQEFGQKTYYKRIVINDIETIFKNYDTVQWEDFFSEI
jgi:hypothetical protein